MKKRNANGRFTKEAAAIVVEMLKENVMQGVILLANGCMILPSFAYSKGNIYYPYNIGGKKFTETLNYSTAVDTHPFDIIGFVNKADRKEFKRRWRERYPK